MKLARFSGVVLNASLFFLACGKPMETSGIKIQNGVLVPETELSSVRLIAIQNSNGTRPCTGTFVNDSQLITAAHCVDSPSDAWSVPIYVNLGTNPDAQSRWVKAIRFDAHPKYNRRENPVGPFDFGILTLPPNSAPTVSPLQTLRLLPGQLVTIAGYGQSSPSNASIGKLRKGTNKIAQLRGGVIDTSGTREPILGPEDGTSVSVNGEADQGAPLFLEGRLAGVDSGGFYQSTADGTLTFVSRYVNLITCDARDFLASKLKDATAKICTLRERESEKFYPH